MAFDAVRRQSRWLFDATGLFLLTAALIWPLFRLDYADKWDSPEGTLISDVRFLRDHWPHPSWQPLWHTGTRFDCLYPPALRYGAAAINRLRMRWSAARAYHVYTGLAYALGAAGAYLLCGAGCGSRKAAWLAALLFVTVSPCFLFLPSLRADAAASGGEPQRLGMLVRYGEGAHMSGVGMLGMALAAGVAALKTGRPLWMAAAAATAAVVAAHNFFAAVSLGLLFALLVWSFWITHQDGRIALRGLVMAALAYGLNAFWLTPSCARVYWLNLDLVAPRGSRWSLWIAVIIVILYVKLTERHARGRREHAWIVFLLGGVALLSYTVVANAYLRLRLVGEAGRFAAEFDLLAVLLVAELIRRLWSAGRLCRLAAAASLAVCVYAASFYLKHPWRAIPAAAASEQRLERRIATWLAEQRPHARIWATGSVRFWLNAWTDLQQLGGGNEQAMLNRAALTASWNLAVVEDGRQSIAWMRCMGTDLAVIHDETSREPYHDVRHPRKLDGLAALLFDDGEGNRIYEIPRRSRSLAHAVELSRLGRIPDRSPEPSPEDVKSLAALLEDSARGMLATRWEGPNRLRIQGETKSGETILVQVAHDSAWSAWSQGRRLPVHKTHLGFLRIDAPSGRQDIVLQYGLRADSMLGRLFSGASFLCLVALLWRGRAI